MRITDMKQLTHILSRLRKNTGINEILRETGAHKSVIRRLKKVAIKNGWDTDQSPIPNEDQLNLAYRASFKHRIEKHFLDPYKEQIKEWKNNKESFVVISHKISRMLNGKAVPQSTLRDYYHREIGKQLKPVNRRSNNEMGIAELDFGYLGIIFDPKERRNRKTWFVSMRFRYSRHGIRRSLYIADTMNVLSALVSIFNELGAVPVRLVIDNFKVAITKACRYDPTETRAFRQCALHYGFLIDPCIPNAPEHKGGVESEVKYIKKNFWPLYRHDEKQRGHDIPYGDRIDDAFIEWDNEIAGIRPIREAANLCPQELFNEEFTHLQALPQDEYEPYNEEILTVKTDYHVRYNGVWYSAPYRLTYKKVLLKAFSNRILLFFKGELVTQHVRSYVIGKRVTEPTHRPKNMMVYLEQTMPWLITRAKEIGEHTTKFIKALANDKVKYRKNAIIGTIMLGKKYGEDRLEKACSRALQFGAFKYHSVKNILEKNKENDPVDQNCDEHGQLYLYQFARNSNDFNYIQKKEDFYGYINTTSTGPNKTQNVRTT